MTTNPTLDLDTNQDFRSKLQGILNIKLEDAGVKIYKLIDVNEAFNSIITLIVLDGVPKKIRGIDSRYEKGIIDWSIRCEEKAYNRCIDDIRTNLGIKGE